MATDERKALLTLDVQAKNADKSAKAIGGIGKEAGKLDKELDSLSKDMRKNFDAASASIDGTADSLRDAAKAADNYESRIRRVKEGGADFSGDVASSTAGIRGAVDVFSGGNSGAVGGLLEMTEAIADVGEFAPMAAQQVATLATNLGPVGLGLAAVVAVAAFAVAHLAAEQKKAADAIKAELDAERSIRERLAKGATSDEFLKELEEVRRLRDEEQKALAANQAIYDSYVNVQKDVGESALTAKDALQVLDHKEQVRFEDLAASEQTIIDLNAREKELNETLAGTAVAANDAAEALRKEAEAKTKAVLDSAAAAGQEVAARRRADDASYESNQARLGAIDDETAAVQAQIDVLKLSGDTSEAVTGQIASLTAQLGALGGEADYIKSSALEASRIRDEAKKAEKERQDEEKKAIAEQQRRTEQAATAQQKYADGIKNANTNLKQATADINTKQSQGLADNLEGMFRDVTDIATEFRRDTFDMDLKANQAERDALTEHYRDIDDIRDDALKSEQEALRDGDFKAAFLAKQAQTAAIKQEQKETLRERSDRQRALGDERADLLRNAQQTRSDRMLALERQNQDTRMAAQRELQQAKLTRTRALEMNAASYRAELTSLGAFLQQRNKLLTNANQQALQGISGSSGGRAASPAGERAVQQQISIAVSGIMRRR